MNALIFLALLLIGLAIVMSIISDEEKSSATFKELEDEFQQNGKVYFNSSLLLFVFSLFEYCSRDFKAFSKKNKISSKCGFLMESLDIEKESFGKLTLLLLLCNADKYIYFELLIVAINGLDLLLSLDTRD